MQTVFSVPITILNGIGVRLLQLLGVPPPKEKSRLHTPDELEMIISEGVVGGLVAAHEFSLIANIFDLDELHVHQMMTPRVKVEAIPLTIGEEELGEKLVTSPFSRFPVYDGTIDHIVGVLHLKDFVTQQLDETPFDLHALLRPPIYLPVSATAYELLSALEQQHGQFAIVVGEYGGTAGIVTLEDLLEEVVGEVWDEFDVDLQEPVTVIAPGHLLAKGSARVDEVEAFVALGEEAGDSTSIAGLMLANVDLPPRRGATVTMDDVVLRIEDVDGMTVESVTIRYPPERHQPAEPPATA